MNQDPIQTDKIKLEPSEEELAESAEPDSINEEQHNLEPISFVDYNCFVKTEPELQIDDFTEETFVSTENRVTEWEPEPEYIELGTKIYINLNFEYTFKMPILGNSLFTVTTSAEPEEEIIQQPGKSQSVKQQLKDNFLL